LIHHNILQKYLSVIRFFGTLQDNRGVDCVGQLQAGANQITFDAKHAQYLVLYTSDMGFIKELYPKGDDWGTSRKTCNSLSYCPP
jgi:hypothetical protein